MSTTIKTTASLRERTRSAVSAATSRLKNANRLSHRPETEDLRGQAKVEEARSARVQEPRVQEPIQEPIVQEPIVQEASEPKLQNVKTEHKRGGRRLVVACDGTWTNSYSDAPSAQGLTGIVKGIFAKTNVTLPSNITRLCRALNTNVIATAEDEPKPTQIVFYHPGIGTDGGLQDKIIGGATGASISDHISECYGFICNNWQVGDEIYLFGFSRGAYTARAIAALISDVGLLTTKGMEFLFQIFEDWKDQNVPEKLEEQKKDEKKHGASGAFKGLQATPLMPSKAYTDELARRGYTRPSVPIKVLGVFDTVGALGVPPIFGLHISSTELMQYSFVNTKVSQVVEHAIQALALDDHRAAFSPAIWEQPDPPTSLKSLTQVWFPGVHCNIGGAGGYEDQSLANDTLAWMVSQLQVLDNGGPVLDFDTDYLRWIFELNVQHCNETASVGGYRGWSLGKMEETLSSVYSFVGDIKPWEGWENWKDWSHPGDLARTPGRYESFNAKKGRKMSANRPLKGSNEKIHPSARVRVAREGKGLDDKVLYFPKGLEGFKIVGMEGRDPKDPLAEGFKWVGKDEAGKQVVLEEVTLGRVERQLLAASAKAVEERLVKGVVNGGTEGAKAGVNEEGRLGK